MRLADPVLGTLYWKGVRRPEDLSPMELDQFLSASRALFQSAEDSVLQHRAGLLDDAAYTSFIASWRVGVALPGTRAAWRLMSQAYGPELSSMMEGLTKEAIFHPSDEERLGRWKATVQAVRSGS
jgi:hypothetical protein